MNLLLLLHALFSQVPPWSLENLAHFCWTRYYWLGLIWSLFDKRPNTPTSVFTPRVFAIGSVSSSICKNRLPLSDHHFEGKAPPFFLLSFLWSTTADPTWQATGTPKSSSLVTGRQEFSLHTTGFEPVLGSLVFSENPLGLVLKRACKNCPSFFSFHL